MAFTQLTNNLNIIQALDDQPNDVGGLTAAQVKAKFDEAGNTIKVYINDTLIAELEAATAAASLGITAPSGLTGTNIQAVIEDLVSKVLLKTNTTAYTPTADYHPATKKYIDDSLTGVVLGQLPDNSITNAKLGTDIKVGSLASLTTTEKSTVVGAINEVDADLAAHLADYASQGAKTYYIDSENGNDSNDGLTEATAFKTWAKASSMIPKFVTHNYTIIIIGSLNETISLKGRIIAPDNYLLIRGSTTTASNHVVPGIIVNSCLGYIIFQFLQSTGQITINNSIGTAIKSCNPRNSEGIGIFINGSLAEIEVCDFGTDVVQDCIVAGNLNGWGVPCMVMSYNNSGNGTRYGLAAGSASVIGKRSTQPTGTTANEYTIYGGVIR